MAAEAGAVLSLDAEVEEAARTIVDRLGSPGALEAVLLALDAGYGVAQIVDGAAALEADGMIPGVGPDGPAQGVFADGPEAAGSTGVVLAAPLGLVAMTDEEAPTVQSIAELLERDFDLGGRIVGGTKETLSPTERDNTVAMVGVLLTLIHTGYSLDQIIEGVVLGEYRWGMGEVNAEAGFVDYCIVLVSSDGTLVTPANTAVQTDSSRIRGCADAIKRGVVAVFIDGEAVRVATTTTTIAPVETTTTTTAATNTASTTTTNITTTSILPALVFPRTYRGGGSTEWSFSYPPPGGCVVEDTLELTLEADGTLSGLYERTAPTFYVTEDGSSLECGDQFFAEEYEVTGSHTPPGAGESETGVVVVEVAGWPDWHIEGEYTPSEMTFVWELDYAATGYEGDDPDPRVVNFVDFELLPVDEG